MSAENRETKKNTATRLLMQRISTREHLDSVEIDEDERLQFIQTLSRLRPMLDKYNTEDIRQEANDSYNSPNQKPTNKNMSLASLIKNGVKPTQQVTEKQLEQTEPTKREFERQKYDQSVSQRIKSVINDQSNRIETLPTVKRGAYSAHKKTDTLH